MIAVLISIPLFALGALILYLFLFKSEYKFKWLLLILSGLWVLVPLANSTILDFSYYLAEIFSASIFVVYWFRMRSFEKLAPIDYCILLLLLGFAVSEWINMFVQSFFICGLLVVYVIDRYNDSNLHNWLRVGLITTFVVSFSAFFSAAMYRLSEEEEKNIMAYELIEEKDEQLYKLEELLSDCN